MINAQIWLQNVATVLGSAPAETSLASELGHERSSVKGRRSRGRLAALGVLLRIRLGGGVSLRSARHHSGTREDSLSEEPLGEIVPPAPAVATVAPTAAKAAAAATSTASPTPKVRKGARGDNPTSADRTGAGNRPHADAARGRHTELHHGYVECTYVL